MLFSLPAGGLSVLVFSSPPVAVPLLLLDGDANLSRLPITPACSLATARLREASTQADPLRDLFGNPFRKPSTPAPAVLAWNDKIVTRLAQTN
jgi:hypothetical protein